MYYPKFLKKNDTIGICAPSAGVGRGLDFYEKSVARLIEEGFKINETFSVRVNNLRSNNAENRAQEFNNLIKDNNTDMVICAAGGDFLCEIMPLIDWEAIKDNPKWIQFRVCSKLFPNNRGETYLLELKSKQIGFSSVKPLSLFSDTSFLELILLLSSFKKLPVIKSPTLHFNTTAKLLNKATSGKDKPLSHFETAFAVTLTH